MRPAPVIGLLLLLAGTAAEAAPAVANISSNAPRAEVVTSLGKPLGALKQGQRELLIYKDREIQLQNGRVLSVRLLNAALTENDADVPAVAAPVTNQVTSTATSTATTPKPTIAQSPVAASSTNVSTALPLARRLPFPTKLSELRNRSVSGLGWILFALGAILGVVACLVSIGGGVWFLVEAFRVQLGWGLACLFLPLASVIFLAMHWDEGGKPFLVSLGGSLVAFGGVALMVFGLAH